MLMKHLVFIVSISLILCITSMCLVIQQDRINTASLEETAQTTIAPVGDVEITGEPSNAATLVAITGIPRESATTSNKSSDTPFRQSLAIMKEFERTYVGKREICSSFYGQKFIDGLKEEAICPRTEAVVSPSSSFTCLSRPLPRLLKSHGASSIQIRLCTMENVSIAPMDRNVAFRFMYPTQCDQPQGDFRSHQFGHCDKSVFPVFCEFQNTTPPLQPTASSPKCDHYVNHTVLWLARGGNHLYHSFIEDYFAMAYFAMVVANEDPREAQIMLVDMESSHFDLDRDAFAASGVMTHQYFEFNVLFGNNYSVPQKLQPNTCFRKSIFSLGPWYLPYQSTCPSAFAYGFRHWMMATLNLTYPERITKRILYLSRNGDAHNDPKQWKQEENFLRHCHNLTLPDEWRFETLEPGNGTTNYIDFLYQIKSIYNATIIIAPHGAHMVHILWTQPLTHFIEITYPGRTSAIYGEIAYGLGLKYSRWSSNDKIDESHHIEKLIFSAIANIDKPEEQEIDQNAKHYRYGIKRDVLS